MVPDSNKVLLQKFFHFIFQKQSSNNLYEVKTKLIKYLYRICYNVNDVKTGMLVGKFTELTIVNLKFDCKSRISVHVS